MCCGGESRAELVALVICGFRQNFPKYTPTRWGTSSAAASLIAGLDGLAIYAESASRISHGIASDAKRLSRHRHLNGARVLDL